VAHQLIENIDFFNFCSLIDHPRSFAVKNRNLRTCRHGFPQSYPQSLWTIQGAPGARS
jgi:hypothetical protein